ncbi:MAG: FHA domain-containing protein [Bacteroidota bacterium]
MTSLHRKLIVMFADVAGSAQLFERLGDTEAVHAVERCLKRMNRSIESYRGRTIQIVGDELLAAFETAEDACQAAIDMQQRIADLPPVSGLKLTIRIGLHVGMVTEEDGELRGDAVLSAARIVGAGRRDQILCSADLVTELGVPTPLKLRPMPELGHITEHDRQFDLFQVEWVSQLAPGLFSAHSIMPVTRLGVRYQGQDYLLDDKLQLLTMGRDFANRLQIDDRKASRSHARIEKRNNGYYLVDTSTNGTFVNLPGRPEVLVRRREMLLDGSGSISFGASKSDPTATSADFEHL